MTDSLDEQKSELFSRFASAFLGDIKQQMIKAAAETGGPISVDPDGPTYAPEGSFLIIRISNIAIKLTMSLLSDQELRDYLTQSPSREV